MKQINANLMKVLSACLLLLLAVQCSAATTVSIADVTVDLGDTVIVPLMVNDITDYGTGTINITYDPSVVHVTAVTSSPDSTVAASNINNVTGFTAISTSNVYGASGDIVFANVTFKAIRDGSSLLSIDVVSLYDRLFNEINETIVDNGLFTSGDVSTSPTPTPTTQSTSSNGGSTTGGVSISTPAPSPTPAPSAKDDGADPASTSGSVSHNDGEAGAETDASGTASTSPTVKPTPGSQSIPGFEAIFAVIGLMILSLILRRDNT